MTDTIDLTTLGRDAWFGQDAMDTSLTNSGSNASPESNQRSDMSDDGRRWVGGPDGIWKEDPESFSMTAFERFTCSVDRMPSDEAANDVALLRETKVPRLTQQVTEEAILGAAKGVKRFWRSERIADARQRAEEFVGRVQGGAAVCAGVVASSIGVLTINNSTFSRNSAPGGKGGAINNGSLFIGSKGTVLINNSTLSRSSVGDGQGGGIFNLDGATAVLQNGIVSNNTGTNRSGIVTSNGYDLSALRPGSRPIDAGNPAGGIDSQGHQLTTGQRGEARPDKEDPGGCDVGPYERQNDSPASGLARPLRCETRTSTAY